MCVHKVSIAWTTTCGDTELGVFHDCSNVVSRFIEAVGEVSVTRATTDTF